MKKVLTLVLVFLCLAPALANAAHISDSAGLFDESETAELASVIADLESSFGFIIHVETANDPLSVPLEQHANTIFAAKYGSETSGMLYLIDATNQTHCLHLSGELAQHITQEGIADALQYAQKDLDAGNHADAAFSAVVSVVNDWTIHLDSVKAQSELEAEAENLSAKTEEIKAMLKEHFQALREAERSNLDEAIEARKAKKELLTELYALLSNEMAFLQQYQNQIVQLLAE